MRVLIVTPAARGDRSGNRITALRWAGLLRSLGHRVRLARSFEAQPCDAMIALHAKRSHPSIVRFAATSKPLIVALTGTDIYGPMDVETRRSFELAHRIVALQPRAVSRLPASVRRKTVAIFQSAPEIARQSSDEVIIAVAGHLRQVKDPFRAAEASRLLPHDSRITIVHAGAALDASFAERAEREQRDNRRYRWLGEVSRREVRALLARSRALVQSSLSEGGSNVVCEALRAGLPVLASRIEGTLGQLGESYPGWFEVTDTAGLARLMLRVEKEPDFLRDHVERLAPLFSTERERALWDMVMRDLKNGAHPMETKAMPESSSFEDDVLRGLTARPKHLSCRFFYDDEGSKLFQAICELPEYYIPRAEREILETRQQEIVELAPVDAAVVELGSGDSRKTRIVLDAFHARYGFVRYLPIDISPTVLEESKRALRADYPGLEVDPFAGEYDAAIVHLREHRRHLPKLILFLGSNIGNFDRPDAAKLLASLRQTMGPQDRLLVGIDLRKDRAILEPAYDDPRGVTAAFNLNLLRRINRELGGNFDARAFAHRAEYQEREGRIAMYLESLRDQTVHVGEARIAFAARERIHTEYSYKYSAEEIDDLAAQAGLRVLHRWTDSRRFFATIVFGI
jgi:dimethylhistidine N-methyltransferase